jgi:redox-sensitive bicupin YhaK (pirin superfamily)
VKQYRTLTEAIGMPWHSFDGRSGAYMLRTDYASLDPFIGIDAYRMAYPFFGPHPHAGMSAVSLMLPEAEGGFINRDSLGDHSEIHPGDLHWTQAGRGMMHEEVPITNGKTALGMQIFVNMSRANKQAEPAAFKVRHADMPVVQLPEGSVRVIAGSFSAPNETVYSSPITNDQRWLTQVHMFDLTIQANGSIDLPVAEGNNAFFVVSSGSVSATNAQGQLLNFTKTSEVDHSTALLFNGEGNTVRIQAGDTTLRGVFFSGTPLREPVVQGGPFTGNSQEDILLYKRNFALGKMGSLDKSF